MVACGIQWLQGEEALEVLHWAMCTTPHHHITMVIETASASDAHAFFCDRQFHCRPQLSYP
jgi:hypothetical protein